MMASSVQFITNAGSLASTKRLLANQVQSGLRSAARAHALKMKAAAERLSDGPLTPADKRRMGYPYAVRFQPGAAGIPDYVINQVRGTFRASWRTRVQETSRGWTITLLNVSPESKFLMGTKRARMRPILAQVDKETGFLLSASVRKVGRKAVQTNGASSGSGLTGNIWGGLAYAFTVGAASVAGGLESAF